MVLQSVSLLSKAKKSGWKPKTQPKKGGKSKAKAQPQKKKQQQQQQHNSNKKEEENQEKSKKHKLGLFLLPFFLFFIAIRMMVNSYSKFGFVQLAFSSP